MRGEAEHYFLPFYNARTINPKYHTQPFYYKLIQQFIHVITDNNVVSRHTIVCRAAQEAGAPHREYINRKKENAIFTPM